MINRIISAFDIDLNNAILRLNTMVESFLHYHPGWEADENIEVEERYVGWSGERQKVFLASKLVKLTNRPMKDEQKKEEIQKERERRKALCSRIK